MPLDAKAFTQLCEKLAKIDLFGAAPPKPSWGSQPTASKLRKAIDSGALALPLVYQTGYVAPLVNHLNTVLTRAAADLEPFLAPIYQHAEGNSVLPQLQRFLAVISNLYRSFLSKAKRSAVNVPLVTQLPPLALFKNSGLEGPFTIPSDDVQKLFPSTIGVVSLPSTYRDDPFLWASLAHETGGHDVLHADPQLLPELATGVRTLFGGGSLQPGHNPTDAQFDGLLWSYWIDEAAADVYGLLNIGPEFAFNLAAFFAAINARVASQQGENAPIPSLRAVSEPSAANDPSLDPHPTDILRLHLAIGVVENLQGLSTTTRNQYATDLGALAVLCAQGTATITLEGNVEIDRDRWLPVKVSRPLADMQESARRVGAFIATSKLDALAGHSVQDVETWDDADELTARQIAAALKQDASIADLGDDAQLLAGATLALLEQPDLYASVTNHLVDALNRSFATDPIWSPPARDPLFSPRRLRLRAVPEPRIGAVEAAAHTGAAAPAGDDPPKKQRSAKK
jgi:hypothetical protein